MRYRLQYGLHIKIKLSRSLRKLKSQGFYEKLVVSRISSYFNYHFLIILVYINLVYFNLMKISLSFRAYSRAAAKNQRHVAYLQLPFGIILK